MLEPETLNMFKDFFFLRFGWQPLFEYNLWSNSWNTNLLFLSPTVNTNSNLLWSFHLKKKKKYKLKMASEVGLKG